MKQRGFRRSPRVLDHGSRTGHHDVPGQSEQGAEDRDPEYQMAWRPVLSQGSGQDGLGMEIRQMVKILWHRRRVGL